MGLDLDIGKEILHGFLGLLPEQQWLEDNISGYDSNKGILNSTSIEALSGAEYIVLLMFLGTNTRLTDSKLMGLLMGYSLGDGFLRMYGYQKTSIKNGTYLLDFPWRVGKDIYNWAKDTFKEDDGMLKRK